MSIYTALREIWYRRAGAAVICLWNSVRGSQQLSRISPASCVQSSLLGRLKNFNTPQPRRFFFFTPQTFQSLMVKAVKTYHKVKDHRLQWIFDFFKDAVICQISLYCSSELSSLQQPLSPPLTVFELVTAHLSRSLLAASTLNLFCLLPYLLLLLSSSSLLCDRLVVVMVSCSWAPSLQRHWFGLVGCFQTSLEPRTFFVVCHVLGEKRCWAVNTHLSFVLFCLFDY